MADQIGDLVAAADTGQSARHLDPSISGLTYRHQWPTHPDGAVAFSVSRIFSARLSLTRRISFRQLELAHISAEPLEQSNRRVLILGVLAFFKHSLPSRWWDRLLDKAFFRHLPSWTPHALGRLSAGPTPVWRDAA